MGLIKAMFIGAIAGVGLATILQGLDGSLGDIARWRSLYFSVGAAHLFFSPAIFAGVTLFSWGFISWSRR